jgi:hypothetical protein
MLMFIAEDNLFLYHLSFRVSFNNVNIKPSEPATLRPISYGCKLLSHPDRMMHSLGRIFGPKRDGVMKNIVQLCTNELYNL